MSKDISAAEKQFAEEYKMVLRKKFRYVLDMPIRLHAANKPKYRMVYATNFHRKSGMTIRRRDVIRIKYAAFTPAIFSCFPHIVSTSVGLATILQNFGSEGFFCPLMSDFRARVASVSCKIADYSGLRSFSEDTDCEG